MRFIQDEDKKTGTFKCPSCDGKVLKNTGYCISCKKKVKPKGEGEKEDKKEAPEKKESWNSISEDYSEREWETVPFDGKLGYYRPTSPRSLQSFVVFHRKSQAQEYARTHSIPVSFVAKIGSRFQSAWGFQDGHGDFLLRGSTDESLNPPRYYESAPLRYYTHMLYEAKKAGASATFDPSTNKLEALTISQKSVILEDEEVTKLVDKFEESNMDQAMSFEDFALVHILERHE